MRRSLAVIDAPCNLGLRPLRAGHIPGTWRAPEALHRAGLDNALMPVRKICLARPKYSADALQGTRLRNGYALRTFNLELADAVTRVLARGEFPVVVGGDCSVLLGALAGCRRSLGPLSLVHVDGHSDFRHPGNYDSTAMLGSAAGMDLALVTGRGESLLTDWFGILSPLVPDERVVQIGERNGHSPDFAWPDVNDTAITRIDVFQARKLGWSGVLAHTRGTLWRGGVPFWVHLDVDVLDESIMPAVDSPGSPGIDLNDLTIMLGMLLDDRLCAGITVTIYDPDLDEDGSLAVLIVDLLSNALSGKNPCVQEVQPV